MIRYKKFISRFFASLILIGFISSNSAFAQGEALFKAQCANCHKVDGDYTGPWLKGARDRQPDKEYIYKWMANPAGMIASDPYAKALFAKWKPTVMTICIFTKKRY
jgi:cytochrome c2